MIYVLVSIGAVAGIAALRALFLWGYNKGRLEEYQKLNHPYDWLE